MKGYGLLLLCVNVLSSGFGQDIQASWLFDEFRFISLEANNKIQCEPFDFIKEYQLKGDTLLFKHTYNTGERKCYTLNEKGEEVEIKCNDDSISDSEFLIAKLTSDSLFLVPINNSAKAISAKLRRPFYSSLDRLASNPEASDVAYFNVIKLYNRSTLYENLRWDTVTLSHTTVGWWGNSYYDIKISSDGHFLAIDTYIPFKEDKPNKDQKTEITYFEDQLPNDLIQFIHTELNSSGINRLTDIKLKGWSSHGRKITLKVNSLHGTKTLTAYEYRFPYTLKPLVKMISDLDGNKDFRKTKKRFSIETSFRVTKTR